MKTLSELAYDAIIEQNIISSEKVGIDSVIESDWNGATRIIITEGETNIDTESQFGAIAQTSTLVIHVLTKERKEAIMTCWLLSEVVFRYIEKLERKQGYGILSITKNSSGIENIPDRTEFKAFRSFNVLNSINL